MPNPRKNDVTTPIRLPKQATVPSAKEILDMALESRRLRKRVELPWQPLGRAEPVILTVKQDDASGKPLWTIYNASRAEAELIWENLDPASLDIVIALRDWYMSAGEREGFPMDGPDPFAMVLEELLAAATKAKQAQTFAGPSNPNQQPGNPFNGSANPTTAPQAPFAGPASPGNPNGAQQSYPQQPNQAYPYQAAPYPQGYPAGQPGQYGYQPGPYGYPYPYPTPASAPAHWAHGYPAPNQQNAGRGAEPLSPEAWGSQSQPVMPAPLPVPMLGDLLIAAGVIPIGTVQAALSLQNASPVGAARIGEILVNSGALPRHILQAAVTLQELARSGTIHGSKVTELLIQAHQTGLTIEQLLGIHAKPTPHTQATQPLQTLHPQQPQHFSQTASPQQSLPPQQGMPPQQPVVTPQNSAPPSHVTAPQETAVPVKSEHKGMKLSPRADELIERESKVTDAERNKIKQVVNLLKQLTNEDGVEKADLLINLFKQAAVVSAESITEANKTSKTSTDTIKALLVKEAIDSHTLQAGLDCLKLLSTQRIAPERAVIALGYAQRSRVSVKDAICDLNWLIPTDDL